ncbi:helix-turn-helix transcriptional regulator [Stenotrophomonas maltophilia]|uniref:helix-turn-helix transcriptional regulator n=1 Tax=Stenotrophomonas maltophilia TaxID=40324 RepID=UPI00066A48E9|nr:hypothetical protein [Stenotrophomonas maltophilia]
MGDSLDSLLLHPRDVLIARKINVYDAINLVVYAKLPSVGMRRGKETVAGFIRLDESGYPVRLLREIEMPAFLRKYEREIESFRYPVAPGQYEPLLERMVTAQELVVPYFFHEHHYLVDKRLRALLFAKLYTELAALVSKGDVILQLTESERTYYMLSHAWMTAETLRSYLNLHGVKPWWDEEYNLVTHSRLERVLFSDGLNLAANDSPEDYDSQQLPSYLFGQMLLQRMHNRFGRAQVRGGVGGAEKVENLRPVGDFLSSADNRDLSVASTPATAVETKWGDLGITKAPPSTNQGRAKSLGSIQPETAIDEIGSERNCEEEAPTLRPKASAAQPEPDEVMLTKRGVAEFLGVSINTVDNRRGDDPDFPEAVAYGGNSLRWKRSEIRQWRDRKKTK